MVDAKSWDPFAPTIPPFWGIPGLSRFQAFIKGEAGINQREWERGLRRRAWEPEAPGAGLEAAIPWFCEPTQLHLCSGLVSWTTDKLFNGLRGYYFYLSLWSSGKHTQKWCVHLCVYRPARVHVCVCITTTYLTERCRSPFGIPWPCGLCIRVKKDISSLCTHVHFQHILLEPHVPAPRFICYQADIAAIISKPQDHRGVAGWKFAPHSCDNPTRMCPGSR